VALGEGLSSAARLARVDRKTVRRYPEAARECGLDRAVGERQLGDDLLSRVAERSARTQPPRGDLREAFAAPGVLESVYTAPFGTGPGAALLLHVRIVETLAHGRDLAWATGQPTAFPDDVAERPLAARKQQLSRGQKNACKILQRHGHGNISRP
jgi:hypothetical protein